MVPSLDSAIRRLIDVLEEENAILSGNRVVAHGALTERKNLALRELMAIRDTAVSADHAMPAGADLRAVRALLDRNAALLKTHIAALGEIADVIVAGLRSAESDGTYSSCGAVR